MKAQRSAEAVHLESGHGWTMYLGDCLEVMVTLDKVDHVITDPPYTQRTSDNARRLNNASGNIDSFITFAGIDGQEAAVTTCALSVARRWVLVWCAFEQLGAYASAAGDRWVRSGVWRKLDATPQFSGDRPAMCGEACAIMHGESKKRWHGKGRPAFWAHATERNRTGHPTPKPVDLMLEQVADFTDPGETILDAFAGSGTTGVACLRLGRRFIGIEKDPKYFALACDRLRAEESGSTLQAARAGQLPLLGGVK
jgi:site-specific DNA-methyltransferase (adenine-specific)